jgi:hypothetical protein
MPDNPINTYITFSNPGKDPKSVSITLTLKRPKKAKSKAPISTNIMDKI